MPVQFEMEDELLIARLSGELDHHAAQQIRQQIDEEVQRALPSCLTLDFSQLTFMDSSGIGLVMGRYKLLQQLGGQLSVTGAQPYIRKVMHLAGIDQLLAAPAPREAAGSPKEEVKSHETH